MHATTSRLENTAMGLGLSLSISGLYYERITIVIDAPSVISK